MKNFVTCPACGSKDVSESVLIETKQLTLGPEFEIEISNYKCSECGEEGDFSLKNDLTVGQSTKEAQKIFVKNCLSWLEDSLPLVAIERALELPFRTLNRWKSGDFSTTSVVLLRILKKYPWIIEVADDKFSESSCDAHLFNAAKNRIEENAKKFNLQIYAKSEHLGNNSTYTFNISQEGASILNISNGQPFMVGT